jgi:hypothetical protein
MRRRCAGRVHAVFPVGPRAEGRPRDTIDRGLPDRGRKDTTIRTALLDARYIAGDKPLCSPTSTAVSAPPARKPASPSYIAAKQGRARRPPSPLRRQSVRGRAERQGRPRRPARPADAVLDRSLRFRHANHGRAGRPRGHLTQQEARTLAGVGVPVDRAVPSALRRRPRRGAPDLRHAAGGRRAHGLHAARQAGRRGAFHAPLLPDRARGRRLTRSWSRRSCARRSARRRWRGGDRQGAARSRLRAGGGQAAADDRPRFRYASRSRCCASCKWRATAAWNCIRWRCASLIQNERARVDCAATRRKPPKCSWICCAASDAEHGRPGRRRRTAPNG